jgi:hypothetical protein
MFDAFDSAVNAAENRGIYYGKVQISAEYVVFSKGIGKLSYVEGKHEPKDRRTEVSFVLSPIDEMGMTNLIQRSVIAESDEWAKIVWPSLRDGCGIKSPRDADSKFVKAILVANGRSWVNKSGDKQEGTAMKFVTIYPDEMTCKAAFASDGNSVRVPSTTAAPNSTDAAMAVDMTPNAQNPERETAKMFLPTLIKSSGGNRDALAKMIVGMPIIAKWFTVDSPEIAELMAVTA